MLLINNKKQKTEQNIIETVKEETKSNVVDNYVIVTEDGTIKNKSNKIAEQKKINNFTVSNISLTSDGKNSYLKADVKSTSKIEDNTTLEFRFLKEDGSELISLFVVVLNTNDETVGKIDTKLSNLDITGAYDLKITAK